MRILTRYWTDAALAQFSKISALPDADDCNVNALRECIRQMSVRDENRGALSGPGSLTWGKPEGELEAEPRLWELVRGLASSKSSNSKSYRSEDAFQEHLIVPRGGRKSDGLTLWVKHNFIPLYHYLSVKYQAELAKWKPRIPIFRAGQQNPTSADAEKGPGSATNNPKSSDSDLKLTTYPGEWIVKVTSIFSTVVACLLPIVAIAVLARAHSMSMILGLICLFTAAFAFGLVLLSSTSSRVEIFTATAA
jgi:hypothetical protein